MLQEVGYSELMITRAGFSKEELEKEAKVATAAVVAKEAHAKAAAAKARVEELQAEMHAHDKHKMVLSDEEKRKMVRARPSQSNA